MGIGTKEGLRSVGTDAQVAVQAVHVHGGGGRQRAQAARAGGAPRAGQ